jgi:hypothetical protein
MAIGISGMCSLQAESRRRAGDARPDAGLEVAPHPHRHRRRAPVGLEAIEVEVELFDPLPEVGVVDAAAIAVEGVDHLEEPALGARRLSRRVQRRGARVLAGDGKVSEDDPGRPLAYLGPNGGAVWAAEVRVDHQLRPLPPHVVVLADGRHGGAGQIAHARDRDRREVVAYTDLPLGG